MIIRCLPARIWHTPLDPSLRQHLKMSDETNPPDLEAIREAGRRIQPWINRTPVLTCNSINELVGAELFFKCENFQRAGSFKFRGASNAVLSLSDEQAAHGVATHSSGNHGAALALAARNRGVNAHVVMPRGAPRVKKDACARYGANVIFCDNTLTSREQTLQEVIDRTGAVFVHSYNDYRIAAGQGTAILELLESRPDLDVVMTPVGGGGLTSGAALVVHHLAPNTKMMAAEPAGADDAYRSHQSGRLIPSENPQTIADGLRTSLGSKTFPIISDRVDEIITVSEAGILQAMRIIWERMKIVVEPSAAVPLGAILEHPDRIDECRIGVLLSGGNVDLEQINWTPAPRAEPCMRLSTISS